MEYELLSALMEQAGEELKAALYERQRRPEDNEAVLVTFESSPPGAQVFLNGVLMGSTPLSIMAEAGTQVVTCQRRGYKDWENDVMLREGMVVLCDLQR
jgi:NAD(P)H-hydrate repair Nnr-like enzyme with NAD(P)H-hydrate epimerase domain